MPIKDEGMIQIYTDIINSNYVKDLKGNMEAYMKEKSLILEHIFLA